MRKEEKRERIAQIITELKKILMATTKTMSDTFDDNEV